VRRGREAVAFYRAAFGASVERAVELGAREVAPVAEAHRWLLGRIENPFGHHWEIGKPLVAWRP
jgi:PhnB protein